MANKVINIRNLTKIYSSSKDEIEALHNISLSFKKGDRVVIEGESGCGKTTFALVLAGIESKTKGDILIYDNHIEKFIKKRKKFYKTIQYVYQNSYDTFDNLYTIDKELKRVYKIHHKNLDDYEIIIEKYKKTFGIEYLNFKDKYINELSGGEIQRISIIRSLIIEPKILILDEPTAQLDDKNKKLIANLITKLRSIEVLIVFTHDKKLVKKGFDRHFIMTNGILKEI